MIILKSVSASNITVSIRTTFVVEQGCSNNFHTCIGGQYYMVD